MRRSLRGAARSARTGRTADALQVALLSPEGAGSGGVCRQGVSLAWRSGASGRL